LGTRPKHKKERDEKPEIDTEKGNQRKRWEGMEVARKDAGTPHMTRAATATHRTGTVQQQLLSEANMLRAEREVPAGGLVHADAVRQSARRDSPMTPMAVRIVSAVTMVVGRALRLRRRRNSLARLRPPVSSSSPEASGEGGGEEMRWLERARIRGRNERADLLPSLPLPVLGE